MEDSLIPTYKVRKKDLDGLIKKGLIKVIGHDPLGRPVYANTELGDLIADELEKEDAINTT